MSTVQDIIDLGFGKSAAARPESITSESELVTRVGMCLREVFQVLAEKNINVLGTSAQVAFAGTGWARPANCLRVIKVCADSGTFATPTIAAGTEIAVVPFDDQSFCEGSPSLTEFGQAFIPTGQSIDPSAGTLTFYYARSPVMPTDVADDVDALFPSFFDDILQNDIALYLAKKDVREEDMATFAAAKSDGLTQLVLWATGQTYSLQQRFPIVTPPLTNTGGGKQQPLRQ